MLYQHHLHGLPSRRSGRQQRCGPFWGIGTALLDALLVEPLIDSKKRTAAQIQELFDCELFELPWSSVVADNTPDPETVAALAARGVEKNSQKMLTDWYPPAVGALSLAQARLLCQRTNLWWDVELRRKLVRWFTAILLAVIAIVTAVGLAGDHSLRHFVLAILAPLMPALLLGVRHLRDQHEAIQISSRFKRHAEGLWPRALSGELSEEAALSESRRLQDVIFHHRSRAPLIFDWVYRHLRAQQQAEMLAGVAELAKKALRR